MMKPVGHIVAWSTGTEDFWEFSNNHEMTLHLYDKAVSECGEQNTYLFPILDVPSLKETKDIIHFMRNEVEEARA